MLTLDQEIKALDSKTSEEDFVSLVDTLKSTALTFNNTLLVDLLSERHPLYKERGSISSQRMRGYLIGAFQEIGTPNKALPYLLEELETSFYPYIVAASARAIRGLKDVHAGVAAFLNKSIYNIWQGDAYVNYSSYLPPYKDKTAQTTALREIFESISWMGEKAKYILPDLHHLESNLSEYLNEENKNRLITCIEKLEGLEDTAMDCCTIPTDIYSSADSKDKLNTTIDLSNIKLQDQEGIYINWDAFFKGKYTVLSFFYTRCHNPRKCIQTIYNLVDIQNLLKDNIDLKDIQTAAITYDPQYDKAEILKAYGINRRYEFNEHNKMFRVEEGMEDLIEQLNIGVNYKGNAVNVHRIEVYIINPEGKIEKSFLRFQAAPKMILENIYQLKNNIDSVKKNHLNQQVSWLNKISTIVLPILIAFFPKCPMCWAGYMNLLGITGIVSIKHQPWLIYVFAGLAIFNLYNLYRLSKRRNGLSPFYLALVGTGILALNYWLDLSNFWLVIGLIFLIISTLLNSLSFKLYHKLSLFFSKKWMSFKYN